jgi:hypothetical protein
MSYTLRGRFESRLAGLAVPLAIASALAIVLRTWWPLELSAAMVAVLLGFDAAYHVLFRYQPGWAALPLGLVELGTVVGIVFAFDVQPPLWAALALFAGGWLAAQLLGHALLPLWRLSYAEDGGELGSLGPVLAVAVALPFVIGATYWYANLPPVVHLGAGVHRGPLVIDQREHLVGAPGAIVTGGIVVRHSDVTISHVRVVGGENGITVDGYRNVTLDHVSVAHAALDGIHVRNTAVTVKHCDVDMDGSPFGQGVDISFGMGSGMSMVEDCRISGGQQGILIDSAMATVRGNRVTGTTLRAISMDEMSMGGLVQNSVRDANGVGIYCNDHSMCMVDGNNVSGTRSDAATGDRTRAGFGLVVDFGAEAETAGNDLGGNPRQVGVFLDGQVQALHE